MAHFLYQQTALPLAKVIPGGPGEVILMDKWYEQASEPVRTQPRRAPGLGGGVWQKDATFAEQTQMDKWFHQASEPVRTQLPRVPVLGQMFRTDIPQSIVAGSNTLGVEYQGFHRPMSFALADSIFPDKWYHQPSEPVRTQSPRVPGLGFSISILTTAAETITVDKWYQQASEPVRTLAKRSAPLDFVSPINSAAPGEVILVSKWYQQPSEPLFWFAKRCAGLASHRTRVSTAAETITLDKWWRQTSEPVRTNKPRVNGLSGICADSTSTSNIQDVIAMDGWYKQHPEPFSRPRMTAMDNQVFLGNLANAPSLTPFVPEPVSVPLFVKDWSPLRYNIQNFDQDVLQTVILSWHYQDPIQVQELKRCAGLASFRMISSTRSETVQSDKWWQPASEPVRTIAVPTRTGESGVNILSTDGEVILPDKWYQPIVGPRWELLNRAAYLHEDFHTNYPGDYPVEISTVDKWWRQASEPVWSLRYFMQGVQYQIRPDTDPETISMDKWWKESEEPVRFVLRGAPDFPPVVVIVPAGEDITSDKWWQQASEPLRSLVATMDKGSGTWVPFIVPAADIPEIIPYVNSAEWLPQWLTKANIAMLVSATAPGLVTAFIPPAVPNLGPYGAIVQEIFTAGGAQGQVQS